MYKSLYIVEREKNDEWRERNERYRIKSTDKRLEAKQNGREMKLNDKALGREWTTMKKIYIIENMKREMIEGDGMRYTEKRGEVFRCWSRARAWSAPVGPSCWNSEAGNSRCCLYCCSSALCGWDSGAD